MARGPRRVWIGTTAVLAVMIAGLAFLNSDLTTGNMFRNDVDSVQGQEAARSGLPRGRQRAHQRPGHRPRRSARGPRGAGRGARRRRGLAAGGGGPAGAKLEVTLDEDPYSTAGFDLIPGHPRGRARGRRGDVLVGGPTAEECDLRESAARDNRLIVPIARSWSS